MAWPGESNRLSDPRRAKATLLAVQWCPSPVPVRAARLNGGVAGIVDTTKACPEDIPDRGCGRKLDNNVVLLGRSAMILSCSD
jgi:hypothetical protein